MDPTYQNQNARYDSYVFVFERVGNLRESRKESLTNLNRTMGWLNLMELILPQVGTAGGSGAAVKQMDPGAHLADTPGAATVTAELYLNASRESILKIQADNQSRIEHSTKCRRFFLFFLFCFSCFFLNDQSWTSDAGVKRSQRATHWVCVRT